MISTLVCVISEVCAKSKNERNIFFYEISFMTQVQFQVFPRATIRHTRRILARMCGIITMTRLRAGRNHRTRISAMLTYCFIADRGPT